MTLQQFVSSLPEALRIKFTQLEQILAKGVEKCQEIIGECSLHIDFDTIGKFLDVNHVRRWSYYRIMRMNNKKPQQVEWIGSTANEVCQKVAQDWQERIAKSRRYHQPLKRAEVIEKILESLVRGLPIVDYTKSEPELCPVRGIVCTWLKGGKCIIQGDKPIKDVEECFL